ncbi:MAG: hypothetical protein VYE22_17295 [Myxococcota bacterium]|nr:hypothetical protein [Myxococcota bacterium]
MGARAGFAGRAGGGAGPLRKCSVGCDVYCPATSSCTLNCAVGAPCSMTAERDAQISVRCGGNTFSSLCGSATCTYACDDRCNCG